MPTLPPRAPLLPNQHRWLNLLLEESWGWGWEEEEKEVRSGVTTLVYFAPLLPGD